MGATIKDIAQKAQVSITAVSMALNGRKGVSSATRQRIMSIAAEMNYTPNFAARTLISKRSSTIGLVISNIADPFYPEIALGVEEKAHALNYNVILINTSGDLKKEKNGINTLLARGVDGIIFSTVTVDDPNLQPLIEARFPFVAVNRLPTGLPFADKIDSVTIDSYSGGYQAIDHLYRLGHDHIAVIAGWMRTSTAQERTRGVRQAMKDRGLKYNPRLFIECGFSHQQATAAAQHLLELRPRPTAFFAQDDNMALGVREVVLTRNLRIPEDVALIGFDDIAFVRMKGVELTTISQKQYEMALIATQILVNKIENSSVNLVNKVVLDADLVIRRSCGFHLQGYVR